MLKDRNPLGLGFDLQQCRYAKWSLLSVSQSSKIGTDQLLQAYNSIFLSTPSNTYHQVGNFPLLPLRTRVRGPAYTLPPVSNLPASQSPEPDDESYDALDEVLSLYRANVLFRNFEIQGPPDRLLVYGILWCGEVLSKVKPGMSSRSV